MSVAVFTCFFFLFWSVSGSSKSKWLLQNHPPERPVVPGRFRYAVRRIRTEIGTTDSWNTCGALRSGDESCIFNHWLRVQSSLWGKERESKGRQSQGFELFVVTFFDSGSTMLNQFECALGTTGVCMWLGSRDVLSSHKSNSHVLSLVLDFKVLWPGSCCQSVLPCLGVDGGCVCPESWSCGRLHVRCFQLFNCLRIICFHLFFCLHFRLQAKSFSVNPLPRGSVNSKGFLHVRGEDIKPERLISLITWTG